MTNLGLTQLAETVVIDLKKRGARIVTAESCTGGLVLSFLTKIPGASDVVEGSFVTYSETLKKDILGVPPETLQQYGAVSKPCALAMARGALTAAQNATLAISVTGIAGPSGGLPSEPVGTVYIGLATKTADTFVERHIFSGSREDIRLATVKQTFDIIHTYLTR